jgi:hypothetical protein
MAKKPQAKPQLAAVNTDEEVSSAVAAPLAGMFEQGRATVENLIGATRNQYESLSARVGSLRDLPPRAVEAVATGASAAVRGAEAIGVEVLSFSKARAEGGIAQARKLVEVRSLPAAYELQSSYVRSEAQAYVDYARKLVELSQALVTESVAPVAAEVRAVAATLTNREAA